MRKVNYHYGYEVAKVCLFNSHYESYYKHKIENIADIRKVNWSDIIYTTRKFFNKKDVNHEIKMGLLSNIIDFSIDCHNLKNYVGPELKIGGVKVEEAEYCLFRAVSSGCSEDLKYLLDIGVSPLIRHTDNMCDDNVYYYTTTRMFDDYGGLIDDEYKKLKYLLDCKIPNKEVLEAVEELLLHYDDRVYDEVKEIINKKS